MTLFTIAKDPCTSAEMARLITLHLQDMHEQSPPESVFALGLAGLRAAGVTMWSAWDGRVLAGCGALKELDARHGEIKSMRTDTAYLRRGVAAQLLVHIINEAKSRGYARLSLETGTTAGFTPAHRLYERMGFAETAPFGDYQRNQFSRFMALQLAPNPRAGRKFSSTPHVIS